MPAGKFIYHFYYWILPSIILIPCIAVYFFDLYALREWIAPAINREFGFIENLQLLLLVLIFVMAVKGMRRKKITHEKYPYYTWLFTAMAAVVIFLEEIDYGLHYYDYYAGKTQAQVVYQMTVEGKLRNIHNTGKTTSVIKLMVYIGIVLLFVLLPLLPKKGIQKMPLLEYFTPSKYIIGTAITLFMLNQIVLYLNEIRYDKSLSLSGNVSEFEEVMTYYIFLLYAIEMLRKKYKGTPTPVKTKSEARSLKFDNTAASDFRLQPIRHLYS
jgi:hypothetical protein